MKRCPECRGAGSIADPERGNAIGPTIICPTCNGNKEVIDSAENWLDEVEARWNDLGTISVEDAQDLLVLARRALAAEALNKSSSEAHSLLIGQISEERAKRIKAEAELAQAKEKLTEYARILKPIFP